MTTLISTTIQDWNPDTFVEILKDNKISIEVHASYYMTERDMAHDNGLDSNINLYFQIKHPILGMKGHSLHSEIQNEGVQTFNYSKQKNVFLYYQDKTVKYEKNVGDNKNQCVINADSSEKCDVLADDNLILLPFDNTDLNDATKKRRFLYTDASKLNFNKYNLTWANLFDPATTAAEAKDYTEDGPMKSTKFIPSNKASMQKGLQGGDEPSMTDFINAKWQQLLIFAWYCKVGVNLNLNTEKMNVTNEEVDEAYIRRRWTDITSDFGSTTPPLPDTTDTTGHPYTLLEKDKYKKYNYENVSKYTMNISTQTATDNNSKKNYLYFFIAINILRLTKVGYNEISLVGGKKAKTIAVISFSPPNNNRQRMYYHKKFPNPLEIGPEDDGGFTGGNIPPGYEGYTGGSLVRTELPISQSLGCKVFLTESDYKAKPREGSGKKIANVKLFKDKCEEICDSFDFNANEKKMIIMYIGLLFKYAIGDTSFILAQLYDKKIRKNNVITYVKSLDGFLTMRSMMFNNPVFGDLTKEFQSLKYTLPSKALTSTGDFDFKKFRYFFNVKTEFTLEDFNNQIITYSKLRDLFKIAEDLIKIQLNIFKNVTLAVTNAVAAAVVTGGGSYTTVIQLGGAITVKGIINYDKNGHSNQPFKISFNEDGTIKKKRISLDELYVCVDNDKIKTAFSQSQIDNCVQEAKANIDQLIKKYNIAANKNNKKKPAPPKQFTLIYITDINSAAPTAELYLRNLAPSNSGLSVLPLTTSATAAAAATTAATDIAAVVTTASTTAATDAATTAAPVASPAASPTVAAAVTSSTVAAAAIVAATATAVATSNTVAAASLVAPVPLVGSVTAATVTATATTAATTDATVDATAVAAAVNNAVTNAVAPVAAAAAVATAPAPDSSTVTTAPAAAAVATAPASAAAATSTATAAASVAVTNTVTNAVAPVAAAAAASVVTSVAAATTAAAAAAAAATAAPVPGDELTDLDHTKNTHLKILYDNLNKLNNKNKTQGGFQEVMVYLQGPAIDKSATLDSLINGFGWADQKHKTDFNAHLTELKNKFSLNSEILDIFNFLTEFNWAYPIDTVPYDGCKIFETEVESRWRIHIKSWPPPQDDLKKAFDEDNARGSAAVEWNTETDAGGTAISDIEKFFNKKVELMIKKFFFLLRCLYGQYVVINLQYHFVPDKMDLKKYTIFRNLFLKEEDQKDENEFDTEFKKEATTISGHIIDDPSLIDKYRKLLFWPTPNAQKEGLKYFHKAQDSGPLLKTIIELTEKKKFGYTPNDVHYYCVSKIDQPNDKTQLETEPRLALGGKPAEAWRTKWPPQRSGKLPAAVEKTVQFNVSKYIYDEINTIINIMNIMKKIYNSYEGTDITNPAVAKKDLIYKICDKVNVIITKYEIQSCDRNDPYEYSMEKTSRGAAALYHKNLNRLNQTNYEYLHLKPNARDTDRDILKPIGEAADDNGCYDCTQKHTKICSFLNTVSYVVNMCLKEPGNSFGMITFDQFFIIFDKLNTNLKLLVNNYELDKDGYNCFQAPPPQLDQGGGAARGRTRGIENNSSLVINKIYTYFTDVYQFNKTTTSRPKTFMDQAAAMIDRRQTTPGENEENFRGIIKNIDLRDVIVFLAVSLFNINKSNHCNISIIKATNEELILNLFNFYYSKNYFSSSIERSAFGRDRKEGQITNYPGDNIKGRIKYRQTDRRTEEDILIEVVESIIDLNHCDYETRKGIECIFSNSFKLYTILFFRNQFDLKDKMWNDISINIGEILSRINLYSLILQAFDLFVNGLYTLFYDFQSNEYITAKMSSSYSRENVDNEEILKVKHVYNKPNISIGINQFYCNNCNLEEPQLMELIADISFIFNNNLFKDDQILLYLLSRVTVELPNRVKRFLQDGKTIKPVVGLLNIFKLNIKDDFINNTDTIVSVFQQKGGNEFKNFMYKYYCGYVRGHESDSFNLHNVYDNFYEKSQLYLKSREMEQLRKIPTPTNARQTNEHLCKTVVSNMNPDDTKNKAEIDTKIDFICFVCNLILNEDKINLEDKKRSIDTMKIKINKIVGSEKIEKDEIELITNDDGLLVDDSDNLNGGAQAIDGSGRMRATGGGKHLTFKKKKKKSTPKNYKTILNPVNNKLVPIDSLTGKYILNKYYKNLK